MRHLGRYFTAKLRKDPSFIIIGSARCGTTSLFDYICKNSEVRAPTKKEIGYFQREKLPSLTFYKMYFPITNKITGEATPYYFPSYLAAKRIKKLYPEIKLVLLLRNPVERSFSHYRKNKNEGYEKMSFEDAIDDEPNRLKKINWTLDCYVKVSQYSDYISSWLEEFGKNLLVVQFEEMIKFSEDITEKICKHIGISTNNIEFPHSNRTSKYALKKETKQMLYEHFKPYNEKLEKILQKRFGWDENL